MSETQFDVIVLGAGPGGYVAAIRAAQLGMKVAIVEKSNLGGTCLNVGCIPSKALLHSTEMFAFFKHHGADHGITAKGLAMDVNTLMEKKQSVVTKLRGGIDQLLKARKITHFKGTGKLLGNSKLGVTALEGATHEIQAKHIIIATGSAPIELPFMRFDGELIISSDDGIALPEVPKKLVVVGAGAIGLELGCVWNRLGSDVTVVELLPNVAPTFDTDICKAAERVFKKQGLKFELGAKVTGVKQAKGKAYLTAERDGQVLEFEADKILVAVGRKPYTDGLGADTVGLQLDERKRIVVDKHYCTNVPGVYAIGDVTTGPMLAHKA
ncbi:MAG: dihydrolipoyl dehydrogenase, partial [Verrucomicrobia bacterium 21-51-4]